MANQLARLESVWLLLGVGLIGYVTATSPAEPPPKLAAQTIDQPKVVRPPSRRSKSSGSRAVDYKPLVGSKPILAQRDRAELGKLLREAYPYVSLQPRLAKFKRPAAPPNAEKNDLTPYLEKLNSRKFEGASLQIEPTPYRHFAARLRTQALIHLHSQNVEDFISGQGFGAGRLPVGPPEYYIVLPAAAEFSPAARPQPAAPLTQRGTEPSAVWAWFPSAAKLTETLAIHQDRFASLETYGHESGQDRVAGFQPHAFLQRPPLSLSEQSEAGESDSAWKITRLQLVSLLMHDEPAVYASPTLPRMSELAEHLVTRALDGFEASALTRLETGENVVYHATLNQIEMLGAIRAVNQCLQCHQVERGALLGAFSYTLHRDPPAAEEPAKAALSAR